MNKEKNQEEFPQKTEPNLIQNTDKIPLTNWEEEKARLLEDIKKDRIQLELEKLLLKGHLEPSFLESGGREFLSTLSEKDTLTVQGKQISPLQWALSFLAGRKPDVLMQKSLIPAHKPGFVSMKGQTCHTDHVDEQRSLLHEKVMHHLGKSVFTLAEYENALQTVQKEDSQ